MEFINRQNIVELSNPGVFSKQLLNPENSSSERVTITEVHLEVGACQPRHTHKASEQIWYATKGKGKLLLAEETWYKVLDIVPVSFFSLKNTKIISFLNKKYIFQGAILLYAIRVVTLL